MCVLHTLHACNNATGSLSILPVGLYCNVGTYGAGITVLALRPASNIKDGISFTNGGVAYGGISRVPDGARSIVTITVRRMYVGPSVD
jgi:hypothetical protein